MIFRLILGFIRSDRKYVDLKFIVHTQSEWVLFVELLPEFGCNFTQREFGATVRAHGENGPTSVQVRAFGLFYSGDTQKGTLPWEAN